MFSVVVQAGGESKRMGQDKGLLPFLGLPLIQRIVERVRPIADELLVTTNQPESYSFLEIPLFNDPLPGKGALGGLYSALSAASNPLVAVVACDMPFVSPLMLTAERAILQTTGSDAVIPDTGKGLEPFHAVYRKETCLPAILQALENNRLRVDSWLDQIRLYTISPKVYSQYDPEGYTFFNINTPEDLQEAIRLAG